MNFNIKHHNLFGQSIQKKMEERRKPSDFNDHEFRPYKEDADKP